MDGHEGECAAELLLLTESIRHPTPPLDSLGSLPSSTPDFQLADVACMLIDGARVHGCARVMTTQSH
jgi:hypothetical protein